jgi:hypothetical protein
LVGGRTEVIDLPESLKQVSLPLNDYGAEAETFMGTCPDCRSQLEFGRRLQEVPRLRVLRVRVRGG